MAREIFFVADDFGLDANTNAAIIHAHQKGALHGAALMMGQPGTEEAVKLALANPKLQIGFHLHLNDSLPLTLSQWPWKKSPAKAGFSIAFSSNARQLVRREIQQQWSAFQATGLSCVFINAHHHLHTHPFVYFTLLQILSPEFKGWIRLGAIKNFGKCPSPSHLFINCFFRFYRKHCPFRSSNTLWGVDRTFRMCSKEIAPILSQLSEGIHEFIFHPRKIGDDPDTTCLIDLQSYV